MKKIVSVQNDTVKELVKLHLPKYRNKKQMFLVEGYHLVEEAYKQKRLLTILSLNDEDAYEDVERILVTEDVIIKLASTKTPQPIIGVCTIKQPETKEANRILLLDDIQDPGNMGTIIRTAAAFSIDLIVCSKECVDIYHDKVIRATQGAIFSSIIICEDLMITVSKLRTQNMTVIGSTLDKAIPIETLPKYKQFALILGNEANGIHPELLACTDVNVTIDISDSVESLNVAIAGAIILYHLK